MKKIINVLELFKGTGSIEKSLKQIEKDNDNYEFNIISLDIDKRFNPTYTCNILDFNYKQYPKDYFTFIWGSPPCDKFSQLRNCWIGRTFKDGRYVTKELIEDEINTIGLPPLYKTQEINNYFKHKYYFIENTSTSKMKNYIDDNFLYDINKYIVSYCKYGFDYRKNTAIWTNLKSFIPKKCNNDCNSMMKIDNKLLHVKLLGNGYEEIDGKLELCNTKEKRDKLINNKKKNNKGQLELVGSGTNKDQRYRIPQPLLIELFNLSIKELE